MSKSDQGRAAIPEEGRAIMLELAEQIKQVPDQKEAVVKAGEISGLQMLAWALLETPAFKTLCERRALPSEVMLPLLIVEGLMSCDRMDALLAHVEPANDRVV